MIKYLMIGYFVGILVETTELVISKTIRSVPPWLLAVIVTLCFYFYQIPTFDFFCGYLILGGNVLILKKLEIL